MNDVIKRLRRAVILPDAAGVADGHLLNCFIADRDELAFEALVRRHGPMVWGVCRRILANIQDAEDAFQATFLVLIRKADSILPREMVANWLHGVAYKTALKTRAMTNRRRTKEKQVVSMPETPTERPAKSYDWQGQLDHELSRLNSKNRVAVVLCDLEGKTRKEAARQLGVPEGTLSARLDRGRKTLANRLARQGLVFTSGALATALIADAASANVPASVVSSTMKAASVLISGHAVTNAVISAKVMTLMEGVMQAMFLTKLKMALAALLAISLIGTAGFYGSTLAADKEEGQESAASAQPDPKRQPEAAQSIERRLAELEKQMARLLDEVKALRTELKGKDAPVGSKGVSSVGEKFTAPVGKDAPVEKDDRMFRVFRLKYARAESTLKILFELFASKAKGIRMVADPRTNSIFVSADDRSTEELQAVLSKIDVPEETTNSTSPKK
jgi:RNA polymerase sigma factor (sigma-70 family)